MDPITLALASVAPQLIRWITGNENAEQVTQAAVELAKKVTGTETAEGAVEVLKANPDLVIQYQQALAGISADLEKAYLADADSARKMQIAALQQDDLFSKRFIYWFAIGWSAFTMIYFLTATFATIPASGQRVADTILGVLVGTVITGFFNFFFGSSARSAKKDETISALSRK